MVFSVPLLMVVGGRCSFILQTKLHLIPACYWASEQQQFIQEGISVLEHSVFRMETAAEGNGSVAEKRLTLSCYCRVKPYVVEPVLAFMLSLIEILCVFCFSFNLFSEGTH